MRSAFRLFSTLVLLVPFVAAACGDDDSTPNGGGATAGAGGSQSPAGRGGSGQAQAGKGGTGAGGRGGSGNTGEADDCTPVGGNTNGVSEPLGDYCNRFYCPASVADAANEALGSCGNTFPPKITYGCGRVTVDYADFSGGTSYTFDSTTNEVILVRTVSDTPFGACQANDYYYGELSGSCADDVTCYPCSDMQNDGQGGASSAGAAGETCKAGESGGTGSGGAGGAGPMIAHCPNF